MSKEIKTALIVALIGGLFSLFGAVLTVILPRYLPSDTAPAALSNLINPTSVQPEPTARVISEGDNAVVANSPVPATMPAATKTTGKKVMGRSASGRSLELVQIGNADVGGTAIVIVGGIAGGEQRDTVDVVRNFESYLTSNPNALPNNATLYLLRNINPDGYAKGDSRFNANRVDLNRNWNTVNWTGDPPIVNTVTKGAGGTSPFSEPETSALRDQLLQLKPTAKNKLIVIVLHSSQRANRRDVYPAYTADSKDEDSAKYAQQVADLLGYQFAFDGDPTTGELIMWCGENEIIAIDILWSRADGNAPTNAQLVQIVNVLSN